MREIRELNGKDAILYDIMSQSLRGKGKETAFSSLILTKLACGKITISGRVITLEECLERTKHISEYSDFIRVMIYLCTYVGVNAARGVIIHWFGFIDEYTGECTKTKLLQKYKTIMKSKE